MTSDPARAGPTLEAGARDPADMIRAAIEREYLPLRHAIAAVVRSVEKGLGRDQLGARVDEVFGEVVYQALTHPEPYSPERPVGPWLMGIARNVLRNEARAAAGRPKGSGLDAVDEADLERLFHRLSPPGESTTARIDVEQLLMRLSPMARQAIEYRFIKGLVGQQLAEALGVLNPGAARTRVTRALQTLRDLCAPGASEVSS